MASSDEIRKSIQYAVGLLRAAIDVETAEASHRGQTIAALGVAEGTLRALAGSRLVDDPSEEPLDLPSGDDAARLKWQELADTVVARRNWLGLSQFDVTKLGGPSEQTLRRIEGNQRCTYELRTLGRLEKTLGWPHGAIRAILDGSVDPKSLIGIPEAIQTARSNS